MTRKRVEALESFNKRKATKGLIEAEDTRLAFFQNLLQTDRAIPLCVWRNTHFEIRPVKVVDAQLIHYSYYDEHPFEYKRQKKYIIAFHCWCEHDRTAYYACYRWDEIGYPGPYIRCSGAYGRNVPNVRWARYPDDEDVKEELPGDDKIWEYAFDHLQKRIADRNPDMPEFYDIKLGSVGRMPLVRKILLNPSMSYQRDGAWVSSLYEPLGLFRTHRPWFPAHIMVAAVTLPHYLIRELCWLVFFYVVNMEDDSASNLLYYRCSHKRPKLR